MVPEDLVYIQTCEGKVSIPQQNVPMSNKQIKITGLLKLLNCVRENESSKITIIDRHTCNLHIFSNEGYSSLSYSVFVLRHFGCFTLQDDEPAAPQREPQDQTWSRPRPLI